MKGDILIVDDDEEFCEEMSGILRDRGYSVSVVFDGLKADKLLAKNVYRLLLLDIKIPGISGLEILKHVRNKDIASKVIVITACIIEDGQPENIMVAMSKEDERLLKLADGIITKPFNIDAVIDMIRGLIG